MWIRQQNDGALLERADADQQLISQSMKSVNLNDGTTIRVFDEGQGEPIIFIPTVPELHFVYASQLEEFSRDFRVILYDPRLSRNSFVRVANRAHETNVLMQALGIQNAHIVAWSDAGSVAYHLAKMAPERCKSVMLLGLADKYIYPQPWAFLSRMLIGFPIENLVPHIVAATILAKFLSGEKVKSEWIVRRALAIPRWTQYVKYSILPCMIDHDPHADEISVPALEVCGDKDALVSVEQAHRMAKLLSESGEAVIIPDGEHMLTFVNAKPVNRTMRDFYKTISAS